MVSSVFSPRVTDSSSTASALLATPDGTFQAQFTDRGLSWLEFPSGHRPELRARCRITVQNQPFLAPSGWVAVAEAALNQALDGLVPTAMPPLDLSAGTDFQRRVWAALRKITPGQTRTYAEIARMIGRAGAARAVGRACGANPIPVLIPCHRVLASGGGPGGFSGGLDWKLRLLHREGIDFELPPQT